MINYSTLKSIILLDAECAPYIITNNSPKDPDYYIKDKTIADKINLNQTILLDLTTKAVKRGDFLLKLGPATGSSLFTKLKTASSLYEPLFYIVAELEGDGLTIPNEQGFLDFINLLETNAPTLTPTDLENIRKVCYDKQIITPADISIALRNT